MFTLAVGGVTLAGFALASAVGSQSGVGGRGRGAPCWPCGHWPAAHGASGRLRAPAAVPFLLFVLALGRRGPARWSTTAWHARWPRCCPAGDLAAGAARHSRPWPPLLANVINNLPAVLVLLPLAAPPGAGAVLAVLLGVNIGPNLTYAGSLATLLWRRIVHAHDDQVDLGEFTRLGLLVVPAALALSVAGLWASLQIVGG